MKVSEDYESMNATMASVHAFNFNLHGSKLKTSDGLSRLYFLKNPSNGLLRQVLQAYRIKCSVTFFVFRFLGELKHVIERCA